MNINEMSPNVKLAVMSSEDQLFPDHNGFDLKSIKKAMKHNRKSKSLRGASTISQQVAKNVQGSRVQPGCFPIAEGVVEIETTFHPLTER